MEKFTTEIDGCFIIQPLVNFDNRGSFIKTFSKSNFEKIQIPFNSFTEEYYSISKKDVLRGFHFQIPTFDHEKIVYCVKGKVFDVVVDLRTHSKTYLKYVTIILDEKNPRIIYIPKGCGHAFYSYEDDSIMMYKVTSEYSQIHDKGIRWNSFDIPWPKPTKEYIFSTRDLNFPLFSHFENPF